MTLPVTFVVGDRVLHSKRGAGHVIAATPAQVTVHFGETSKGKPIVGIYDEAWFSFARARFTSLHNLSETA